MKKMTSSRDRVTPAAPVPAAPSPGAAVLLLAMAAGLVFLSLFQWMELRVLEGGGHTVCGLSATLNCEVVWTSDFAKGVQRLVGVPVAGLGLVYGLSALALSLWLVHQVLARRAVGRLVGALRLTAAVGALSTCVFVVASVSAGAACLTCMGTYLLVLGFNVVAFRLMPGPLFPPVAERPGAVGFAALGALAAYLLVLPAGLSSPPPSAAGSLAQVGGAVGPASVPQPSAPVPSADASVSAPPLTGPEQQLASYLAGLPAQEKLMVSRALASYRAESNLPSGVPAARFRLGPENAPLRMLEWTDIRCGHCRALVEAMKELKRVVPPGRLSVEPRHFPLDNTCNPSIPRPGPGTSCVAAKAQICLEGAPDYWELQARLFERQQELTPEKVVEIASAGSMPRAKLEACMQSPDTARALQEDIDLALRFGLEGTPLVVLNGRKSLPVPSFLFAMAVTGGNPESGAFAVLPPPPLFPDSDHAGHAH